MRLINLIESMLKQQDIFKLFNTIINRLQKNKIPCNVMIFDQPLKIIQIVLGDNYPDSLADKIFDILGDIDKKKYSISGDAYAGDRKLKFKSVYGGKKRYR